MTTISTLNYEDKMKKIALLLISLSSALTQPTLARAGEWSTLKAQYLIHSQTATYPEAPTKADRVLTVVIDGHAAKELFDLSGPDSRPICSNEKGDRARRKKGLACIYTAQDQGTRDGPYRCWVALNLRTGQGDVRVSC